jgi:hypothetical protein
VGGTIQLGSTDTRRLNHLIDALFIELGRTAHAPEIEREIQSRMGALHGRWVDATPKDESRLKYIRNRRPALGRGSAKTPKRKATDRSLRRRRTEPAIWLIGTHQRVDLEPEEANPPDWYGSARIYVLNRTSREIQVGQPVIGWLQLPPIGVVPALSRVGIELGIKFTELLGGSGDGMRAGISVGTADPTVYRHPVRIPYSSGARRRELDGEISGSWQRGFFEFRTGRVRKPIY